MASGLLHSEADEQDQLSAEKTIQREVITTIRELKRGFNISGKVFGRFC